MGISLSTSTPATTRSTWPSTSSQIGDRLGEQWLVLWACALAGYAIFGRGFAYIGLPPLFVGEAVLLAGLVALVMSRGLWSALGMPIVWLLGALAAWGICRTVPYVGEYGVDALRDAVIWGYGAFALIVASVLIASPHRLVWLVLQFRRYAIAFLVLVPCIWVIQLAAGDAIPHWPWANVPVITAKGGDISVHMAGICAFWIAGLAGTTHYMWLAPLLVTVPVAGMKNRGGLVSFTLACIIAFSCRPRSGWAWRFGIAAIFALTVLALTDIHVKVPGQHRDISFQQLMSNVTSVAGDSKRGALEGTKEWRLNWWRDIVDYTIHGKYRWTGKGFGINLANDDGYQVYKDESLRSPHNGHLTMLARAGVPGLAIWLALQGLWALTILDRYLRCQRGRDPAWAAVFIFLLAFWAAFMVNASFDVFIEGPMGGIWFWSIFGIGIASCWIHQHQPEILYGHANTRRA